MKDMSVNIGLITQDYRMQKEDVKYEYYGFGIFYPYKIY